MTEEPNKAVKQSVLDKHFPLFSIVTITKDNCDGLKKTMHSVDAQTFTDFEWIVIDGKSTDGTLDILRERRSETRTAQNPFRFISEYDEGIYDAMNTGISEARGHYILFLNAGDELASPDILEIIEPCAVKKPEFIYGDALEPLKNGKAELKSARRYKELPWGMITHHQAMFYRRHSIRDFKISYSLLYDVAADYDFTVRFLLHAKKIRYIPKPICIFEQGGLSQKQAAKGRREQYIIREKLDMLPVHKNLWILFVQTLIWNIRRFAPPLYWALRKAKRRA